MKKKKKKLLILEVINEIQYYNNTFQLNSFKN